MPSDDGDRTLAPQNMRNSDDGHIADSFDAGNEALGVQRAEPLATGLDCILDPIPDDDGSVRINCPSDRAEFECQRGIR